MKPRVKKIAMERMQILIDNAILNAKSLVLLEGSIEAIEANLSK